MTTIVWAVLSHSEMLEELQNGLDERVRRMTDLEAITGNAPVRIETRGRKPKAYATERERQIAEAGELEQ